MRRRGRALRAAIILVALAVGACRSVDPGLGIASMAPTGPAPQSAPPAAASADVEPVQFLPVVGIPEALAPKLSAALGEAAAASSLPILPAANGVAAKRLKGYLSTVREADGAFIVYVWDIVDPAGNRIDRLQGRVRFSGTGESWSEVGDDSLRMLAQETVTGVLAHGRVALQ